jgi:hypothetical protein
MKPPWEIWDNRHRLPYGWSVVRRDGLSEFSIPALGVAIAMSDRYPHWDWISRPDEEAALLLKIAISGK